MRGLFQQPVRVEKTALHKQLDTVVHRAGVSYVKASYPRVRLCVTYLRGSGSYCVLGAPFARRTERKDRGLI